MNLSPAERFKRMTILARTSKEYWQEIVELQEAELEELTARVEQLQRALEEIVGPSLFKGGRMNPLRLQELEEKHQDFFPCDECVYTRDESDCKNTLRNEGYTQCEEGCYLSED